MEKYNKGYCMSVCSKAYKDIWKQELKENLHLFDVVILSEHETRQQAFEEELRLQISKDIPMNTLFVNKSLARKNGHFIQRPGWHHTDEAKRKIGLASIGNTNVLGRPSPKKGIPSSLEAKQKMSASLKGRKPSNKGVPMTEEQKELIQRNMPTNKPITINGIEYHSVAYASRCLGMNENTLRGRIKRNSI